MSEFVAHPTDRELGAWLDGDLEEERRTAVESHIAACTACRVRLAHSGPTVPFPALPGSIEGARIPDALLKAFAAGDVPQPQPGQLWRLEWEGAAALAMTWGIHDDFVTVIPVGEDPAFADEYTLHASPETTPIGISLALWVGLESAVPMFVLERLLGPLDLLQDVEVARKAFRAGVQPKVGVATGSPITDPLDEGLQYREELAARITEFAEARWLPEMDEEVASIEQLAEAAAVSVDEIPDRLALPPAERLRFHRKLRPIYPEEAEQLSELLRTEPSQVLATNPRLPKELVTTLDQPRWRPLLRASGRSQQIPEPEIRQQVAYSVLAHAARRTGETGPAPDWERLIKDYFGA